MTVKKYYSTAADVIYDRLHFQALYGAVLELESAGLSRDLRFVSKDLPPVTVCNCVRTIADELRGRADILPGLESCHRDLTPVPDFPNPDPQDLEAAAYEFFPHDSIQRTAILVLAGALLTATDGLGEKSAAQLRRFIGKDEAGTRAANLIPVSYKRHLRLLDLPASEEAAVLCQWCLANACMESVEHTLRGKNFDNQRSILNAHIETFIGESGPLKEMLADMFVQRLQALNTEEAASRTQAGKHPSGQGTVSQLAIVFQYLLDELHLNFNNSNKTDWARFISFLSGYSEQTIRRHFQPDYDNKHVQQDLAVVQAKMADLFPLIAQKIENDKKPESCNPSW